MAIVLPRKKKIDIFAPSQAIQDAKNKLGPAYFDITLLECSRNAVELTKLVGKWGDIDKAKVKVIRDIEREQQLLLRALKHHRSVSDIDTSKRDIIESIETADGKTIAPGFRFKANGELKSSDHHLPHVLTASASDNSITQTSVQDNGQEAPSTEKKISTYNAVDYNKEIRELQEVLDDIYADLAKNKNKIISEQNQGAKSYLRAHSHDYIILSEKTEDVCEQCKPNDRFAFQPGSTKKRDSYLHRQKLKTPSHRTCVGCQCKLKYQTDDLTKIRKLHEPEVGKIKWSYVPRGKLVQSSTSHFDRRASLTKSVIRSEKNKTEFHTKSNVHFDIKEDDKVRAAVSTNYQISQSSKDDNDVQSVSTPSLPTYRGRSRTTQGSSDVGSEKSRILSSSLSYGSGLSRARVSSAVRIDHESRLNMLKTFQAEQEEQCEHKVKDFLHKLDSVGSLPGRKWSNAAF